MGSNTSVTKDIKTEWAHLMFGDCLQRMKEIPDNSVDMVITSPPYDNLRDYNNSSSWSFRLFQNIAIQLKRVLKKGGVIVWIVNDATIDGSETGTSFKQALYFKEIGLCLHDTMIWQKISPFQSKNRYIPCFEYMFILSKGQKKTANLIRDRRNKWAGDSVHGTGRKKDGSTEKKGGDGTGKKVKHFSVRYNIWDIPGEKHNTSGHPAPFSKRIADGHIKTWSNHGDVVLDPFMGSGTSGIVSKFLNRKFIGIEIDPEYYKISTKRLRLETNDNECSL